MAGPAKLLSDSESESGDEDVQLTINEHFAKAYAAKKEREELSKLKEKYGSDIDEADLEESDSEDESEDEDAEELTPAVDAAILRTLAKIKRRDPEIYDGSKSIFEQEKGRVNETRPRPKPSQKDNAKPVTIKQQILASMLESTSRSPSPEPKIRTHIEEQEALRFETINVFHNAIETEDEDDNILVPREKTKDDIEREEEEYQDFLRREVGEDIKGLISVEKNTTIVDEDKNEEGKGKPKKKKKKSKKDKEKPREEDDQEFLMNYIMNRGWLDRESKRIPTYKEITRNSGDKEEGEETADGQGPIQDGDEEFEELAETFEISYNFRFEEPDAAVIQTHPRNIESTVRRKDDKRKEARERRKQRKEEELQKKKEEVRRMKALKMKELRQKLEKIGEEGGVEIDPDALGAFDLDGEWDPERHEKQMAELYNDDYNAEAPGEEEDILEKPQWDDDVDIGDIVEDQEDDEPASSSNKKKKKKKKKQNDAEMEDGVDIDAMDADELPAADDEEWDGTEEMRKRKVQEYLDEIYSMDFNDMVGDMPTRFHYTQVAPQSYSLTPAEILLATDKELNEFMSIKKIAPYRKDGRWDTKRAERLKILKDKLKERGWGNRELEGDAGDGSEVKKKKRKGKKERQRGKVTGEDGAPTVEETSEPPAKKRRKD
ncbi:hypothetical protein M422DRAFT_244542 [Sphaerobolus stellatus SS14]|nr:hypothetical protein M422DRAFT_244542 [Sphaerobolus stellatus SS14]